jgi:hypothetical protein
MSRNARYTALSNRLIKKYDERNNVAHIAVTNTFNTTTLEQEQATVTTPVNAIVGTATEDLFGSGQVDQTDVMLIISVDSGITPKNGDRFELDGQTLNVKMVKPVKPISGDIIQWQVLCSA